MHQEIEKLIDLGILDGHITEKERKVILNKAVELGVDVDEVEMILDAKIFQLAADKPKEKEKVGNIKICPSCGGNVKAMELLCNQCGHEYTNTQANSSILELINKIEKIESDKINQTANLNSAKKILANQNFEMRKNEIISNFPIPNNREDILEFLTYSTSKITIAASLDNPWLSKADEIIMKSRFLFKGDQNMMATLDQYEKEIKKRKKGSVALIFICIFLVVLMASLVMIFGKNLK